MSTWAEIVGSKPMEAVLALVALAVVTVGAALVLRRRLRRATSLRTVVLAVAFAALALGIVAAMVAARLMLLDSTQAWTFVSVLVMASGFSALLAVLVARPLGDDVSRLEVTVRSIEAGDRTVRTGLDRNDELGHVGRALDDLVEQLDRLEREREIIDTERRAVLSAIGHDLRTPLAAIRAAVEALRDGVAPDPDRYLASMEHDLVVLGEMIDDLFLLARIDAGTLDLDARPIDVVEVVHRTVTGLLPIAERTGVTIDPPSADDGRIAIADPRALARVLQNLLDNAVRHTPPGSSVRVEVEPAIPERPDRLLIRVSDDGPGFPADFVDMAFEPLTRADPARTRATGGSGLGLAIARGIVVAHHGEIWIEPGTTSTATSTGASVVFTVPTPTTPTPIPASRAHESSS